MNRMVLGVFSDSNRAEDAIDELEASGFDPKDISVIMKDRTEDKYTASGGEKVAEGAASGVATGGVLGGLAGLLIGLGAITIPGIGALLIGGPIAVALGLTGAAATTITGAVTGALAGGLVGALVGLGVPEDQARIYEQEIKKGSILVALTTGPADEAEVMTTLENHGADHVRIIDHAKGRREMDEFDHPMHYHG
jgi:hypothetical protein